MTAKTKTARAPKTAERRAKADSATPGLRRLRANPVAEAIRAAVLDDQENGRAAALAKIEAEKAEAVAPATGADAEVIGDGPAGDAALATIAALPEDAPLPEPEAPQTPTGAPAPVPAPGHAPADAESPPAAPAKPKARFTRGATVPPTDVPTPAPKMPGMSVKNSELYMRAATGEMPTPPDFSSASYAPDRKRLQELVDLADAGDAAALRAYAIKVYSAALECDRFRHRAILAIEARARQAAAA